MIRAWKLCNHGVFTWTICSPCKLLYIIKPPPRQMHGICNGCFNIAHRGREESRRYDADNRITNKQKPCNP